MKINVLKIAFLVQVFSSLFISAQAQWNCSGVNCSNAGNITVGNTTTSTHIRLEVIKSPSSSYTAVFRNALPGNDSYLYHAVSPTFHLIGSSKNGTGVLRNIGFAIGTNDGDQDIKMAINTAGEVGIGTLNTYGYKLAVVGKIIAEEVVVKLSTAWPDYVFKPSYNLRPLSEVRAYINQNGHLPEVPTAAQVKEDGVALASMNATLLKKIEELTLYILQQEERIKKLEEAAQKP